MNIREKMEDYRQKKWEVKSEKIRKINIERAKKGKGSRSNGWGEMVDSGTGGLNKQLPERMSFLAEEQKRVGKKP